MPETGKPDKQKEPLYQPVRVEGGNVFYHWCSSTAVEACFDTHSQTYKLTANFRSRRISSHNSLSHEVYITTVPHQGAEYSAKPIKLKKQLGLLEIYIPDKCPNKLSPIDANVNWFALDLNNIDELERHGVQIRPFSGIGLDEQDLRSERKRCLVRTIEDMKSKKTDSLIIDETVNALKKQMTPESVSTPFHGMTSSRRLTAKDFAKAPQTLTRQFQRSHSSPQDETTKDSPRFVGNSIQTTPTPGSETSTAINNAGGTKAFNFLGKKYSTQHEPDDDKKNQRGDGDDLTKKSSV